MLGMSFSPLFDMTAANDFLKGLLKLLDEWENWTENAGSKTMVRSLRALGTTAADNVCRPAEEPV